jgi:hypothetical protein
MYLGGVIDRSSNAEDKNEIRLVDSRHVTRIGTHADVADGRRAFAVDAAPHLP